MPVQRAHSDPPALLAEFRRASERVVERLAGGPVAVTSPRHVRAQLDQILAALERTLAGAPPGVLADGPLDRLELLRTLRTETLRTWEDGSPGLLTLMRALDEVEEGLPEARRNAIMGEALTPFARELLREVSHLLRSPLGSIVMLAEMLRDEDLGPLTEAQARQVSIIHRAALGISCTAHDILTLSHGRDRSERTTVFSLAESMQNVRDILGPIAESKGQSVHLSVEADLTRLGPELTLREILLTLGLRAALEGHGGALGLSAEDLEGDTVLFSVRARPPEDDNDGADALPCPAVFRIDEDDGGFTLSPGGLGLAAVADVLRTLGSELERVEPPEAEPRLSFRLRLPRA